MPHPIDIHVGKRLRLRRSMLGMSQENIAKSIGITFQQVQKYERGVNRMGASRLFDFARILSVPVSFFFEESDELKLDASTASGFAEPDAEPFVKEQLNSKETLALVRNYYGIQNPAVRKKVAGLIKALSTQSDE